MRFGIEMRKEGQVRERCRIGLLSCAAIGILAPAIHVAAQNLATPRALVSCLLREAMPAAPGKSAQGYLGVDIRDVGDGRIASLKLSVKEPHGAEILHVDHDGPAGKAGLRERDIILSMNGQAIDNGEQLRRMLRETPPGRTVSLTISRDGQQQTVSAQMANRDEVEREAWEQHIAVPDPQGPPPPPVAEDRRADDHRSASGFFSSPGRASRNFLGSITLTPGYTGAILETLAPQLADFFGAQGRSGLLVRSVDANSPAAQAGMHAGDVVVRVNSAAIATNGDWLRAVRDNKGRTISVVVLRDRREQTLAIVPNARHHGSLIPELWPHFGNGRAVFQPVTDRAAVEPHPMSMM